MNSANCFGPAHRFTEVTEVSLKPNPLNAKDNDVAKSQEGERLLKSLSPGEKLILLDERGRDVSSEEIAKLLARASDDSWTKMAFAIGGPYGHSEEVRQKADDVLKLSSCVLNHSVAHVVLLEQLYRAHSMLRGEPYHHV